MGKKISKIIIFFLIIIAFFQNFYVFLRKLINKKIYLKFKQKIKILVETYKKYIILKLLL